MRLYLKPLFMGEQESLSVDGEVDLSALEYRGEHPFAHPVRVQGAVTVDADIVTLRAVASFLYEGNCDRCTTAFRREMRVPVEHVLVTSLNSEDSDGYVLVDNYQLPLDELVREDLILSLPTKSLCRDDCRGLCPRCGKNLNEGLCGCRAVTVDPRLEALRQLMTGEDDFLS